MAGRHVIELAEGLTRGDPEVLLAAFDGQEEALDLLRSVVQELIDKNGRAALSGLKDQIRRIRPGFIEKTLGYRSFLQFSQAADTAGAIHLK
jgi:hypothetical protein